MEEVMPDTVRICCPLCGWWRTSPYGIDQQGEIREVKFDKVDLENPMMRVERLRGAGRGSSKATINLISGKKLEKLPTELREQIKDQCHKILDRLEG